MAEKIKSVQPKTGKNHKMFGSRFLRLHNFRNPRWTVQDKYAQYEMLTTLHEKDQKLAELAKVAETRQIKRKTNVLHRRIEEDQQTLKIAINGDPIRVQNLLQNRKDLQRMYQSMPMHLMIENIKQRTFAKRKELDRYIDRQNKLTSKYENGLLELSRMQDRIKYSEAPIKDNEMSTQLRLDLKNTETRATAIRFINQAYTRILETMMKDALFFDHVMDALDDDVTEQQSFIDTTIRLGRPAIANHSKLNQAYKLLQQKTERDIKPRLETLREYRNQIEKNNVTIKELVRKDSDFIIFPNRYQRNTNSMVQIKNNLDDVEKVMKSLKEVTSCDQADEVFPRVRKQYKDIQRMKSGIQPKERERDGAIERDIHGKVQRDALSHSLTAEEIERAEEIKRLRSSIRNEQQVQSDLKSTIDDRNVMLSKLKLSFQHALDVLRHVGDKHTADRAYTNPDLGLPLLNFTALAPRARPPSPAEEDMKTVLDLVTQRVDLLMKVFDKDQFVHDREKAIRTFHDAVLNEMRSEDTQAVDLEPEHNLGNVMPIEDPSVLSRQRLKAISSRIVEQNSKKDEFEKKKK